MSVINQVLVELEKRRASSAERGILPDHVRALPDSGGSDREVPWLAVGAVLAALAVTGAAGIALFGPGRELRAGAAPVAGPAPDPLVERMVSTSAAVTGGASRPGGRLSLELASAAAPGQAAEAEPESVRTREPNPAARVVAQPGSAEAAPAAAAKGAATSSPVPAEAAAAVRVAKEPTQPAVAPVAEKTAPTGKPGIEKQVRQPSARELADNEYRKAAGSLHQGRAHEALEGFRAALNLNPGHHGARQALVALLVENKASAEAERVLQEGLKLAPEQIGFAMTLARLQLDRGDGPDAIATLQGSLAHAQGSPDYAAFLAALLQRQGRHEQAIEQFQAALRARPATGVWWLGFAISLQAVNRGPEAQEAYRRAKTTNNLNAELTAFADQRLRQLQ